MLWFSAPTSLNNDLLDDGVILEKYNEAVIFAVLATFTMPFWSMYTPRSCFLRSFCTVWTNTPVWNVDTDMIFYLTTGTVTTTWIPRRSESLEIRKMHDAISSKQRDESDFVVFTFSISPEIEIRGNEESGIFEESHDKDKVELVIRREAKKDRLGALLR